MEHAESVTERDHLYRYWYTTDQLALSPLLEECNQSTDRNEGVYHSISDITSD
jgi:hypothetical protein